MNLFNKKGKSFFNIILLVFTFLVLLRALFVGTVLFIENYFNEGKVVVPDFVGMNIVEATKLASRYKLILKVIGEDYDEYMEKNVVIKQNPPANITVKKGRVIGIILSKGKKKSVAPNVEGLEVKEAESVILNNRFSLGKKTYVYDDKVKKNYVVAQDPEPGANVREGTFINLLISKGKRKEYVILPDFTRGQYKKVKDIILSLGLNIGKITYDVDTKGKKGEILSQTPPPGTKILKGENVDLVVNKAGFFNRVEVGKRKRIDFSFRVPDGILPKEVKVILIDDLGIREVYRKKREPGSLVKFKLKGVGRMKALIYVDNIKVGEKEY
jgi:serine/threonine-protein kinase